MERYCEKCGAYIPQGVEKCIACGSEENGLPPDVDCELPTSELGSSVITIPVDGAAIRNAVLSRITPMHESAVNLDALLGAPFPARLHGKIGKAYISSQMCEHLWTVGGRDIEGNLSREVLSLEKLSVIWSEK